MNSALIRPDPSEVRFYRQQSQMIEIVTYIHDLRPVYSSFIGT
jgi:hypothetical protein